MTTRGRLTVALIAAVAMTLTACGGGGGSETDSAMPKDGGTMTVGLESPWVSLDPAKVTTFNGLSAQRAIYDGLFTPEPDGKLKPTLATGYEVSDDGLTYTVTLRSGIKFQDGTDFNADAVKKHLDRMRAPETASTSAADTSVIADIQAPSPDTVVITLSEPSAGFAIGALAGPAGFIPSPAAIDANPKDISANPIGAGPFKYDSEVSGDSLKLVKWDGYWQKDRPYLDGVSFKVIPDEQARYASLSSGAIQVAENVSTTSVDEAKNGGTLTVDDLGAIGSEFVMYQTASAPFDDIRARQAASMAIDPVAINKTLFNGLKKTGQQSPFPPGHPYDVGKVKGYASYDLSKAKALVKELGGLSFELNVINRPDNVRVAQALVSQWDAAGITATIVQVDSPTGVADARAKNFQAQLYRWRGSFDPDGNVFQFYYSQFAGEKGSNNTSTVDPAVDKAIMDGREALDPADRKNAYTQLSEALADYTPYTWLWSANWFRLLAEGVHGIPKLPDSVGVYTDAFLG